MTDMAAWLVAAFPSTLVVNVEIGDGVWDSVFMSATTQLERFAATVRADARLDDGFVAIGHSQGALLVRAYATVHQAPPVRALVSLVGPQAGLFGTPFVDVPLLDALVDQLLASPHSAAALAAHFSVAGYWRDPFGDVFARDNVFLQRVNNLRAFNATLRDNFLRTRRVLLVADAHDKVVRPLESAWFATFAPNSTARVVPMNATRQYVDDLIGLRTLAERGRLHTALTACGHQQLVQPGCGERAFQQHVVPFLALAALDDDDDDNNSYYYY